MRRPNWRALRGSGESAVVAREALAAELDRSVGLEPPVSWSEVVDLGLGVARAVLGEEPKSDPRPCVRGCEPALRVFDKAVSLASSRKRAATSWEEWREANYEVRRCKRRRGAWLRDKEVQWWDDKARLAQDQADKGDAFGVFATFRELRLCGSSAKMGEVQPAEAQRERDAWAEHFRKIGEGAGEVKDHVWANVPFYSPMDAVWGDAPAPNELHAALRQMSLGKASGEDGVTAELLKFGRTNLWEQVVKVCREQWLILTEVAPGEEVSWPAEWCIGLVIPLWKRKGNKKDRNTWRGITLLSVGSKLLARVVATRLRSWFDGHDDTVTCASASYAPAVEQLFDATLQDWSQRRNAHKTERLLVVPNAPRVPVGEPVASCSESKPRVNVVRHVGGCLSADGRHDHDTSHRISRARRMVGMLDRSWARGQKDRRGRSSPLTLPHRLRLMKARVDPILTTFCRSRSWPVSQLRALQRAQAYALRRAFGMDRFSMQAEHVSDRMMFEAAEWETIDVTIRRACWKWLGHVARMHVPALPKLALWGWPLSSKPGSRKRLQGSWLKTVLAKTSISSRDWFRIAVSRGGQWQAAGRRFFFLRSGVRRIRLRVCFPGGKVLLFQCHPLRGLSVSILCPLLLLALRFVRFVVKIWVLWWHWVPITILFMLLGTRFWLPDRLFSALDVPWFLRRRSALRAMPVLVAISCYKLGR